MKAMIIADIHIKPENRNIVHDALKRAYNRAIEEKVTDVIFAGDQFDRHSIAPKTTSTGSLLQTFIAPMDNFLAATEGTRVWAIRGNHDMAPPGHLDILQPIARQNPRFAYFTMPGVADVNGVRLLFLPWLSKKALGVDRFNQCIGESIKFFKAQEGPKILIGHFDIAGAMVTDKYSIVGGEFEMTRGQLGEIVADYYFIGHIHKRQALPIGDRILNQSGEKNAVVVHALHIGALIQHNHGETGNPTGAILLDTDTGNGGMRSNHLQIRSRQFWTLDLGEDDTPTDVEIAAGDITRVLGSGYPDGDHSWMAEYYGDVAYDYIPKKEDVIVRRPDALDINPGMNTMDLFTRWVEGKAIATSVMKETLDRLESFTADKEFSGGGLSFLHHVHLQNIGPHKDVVVSFTNGINAIVGPVGSGKTFVLEAPVAAALGFFPSRPSKLTDRITKGHVGDAYIEACADCAPTFDIKFQRELSNTTVKPKHNAYTRATERGNESGKPSEVNEYNRSLLGDPSVFLSTVFTSQGHAKDLVNADPADRKKILASLLGHDYLEEIHQMAAKELNPICAKRTQLMVECDRLQDVISKEPETLENIKECKEALEQVREEIKLLNDSKDAIQGKIDRIQHELMAQASYRKDNEKAQAELTRINGLIRDKRTAQQEFEDLLREEPFLRQKADEYDVSIKLIEEEYHPLEKALENAKQNLISVNAEIGVKANQADSKMIQMDADIAAIDREIAKVKDDIAACDRQSKMLDDPRCSHEVCKECPLLENARTGIVAMKAGNAHLAVLMEDLKRSKDEWNKFAADWSLTLITLEKRAAELVIEKDNINEKLTDERYAIAYRIIRVSKEAKVQLAKMEGTKNLRDHIAKELETLNIEKEKADIVAKKTLDKVANAPVIESLSVELRHAEDAKVLVARDITMKEDFLQRTLVDLGRHEKQYETIADSKRELDKLQFSDKHLSVQEGALGVLVEAFGKDGIPQHLIDSSLADIHKALDDVMEKIGMGFRVRILTQDETQRGKIVEVLRIEITNPDGHVMDISECSGGEQKMLKMTLRIALALYQARFGGSGHKVLMADEPFDGLNEERSEAILMALDALQEEFNQIILSTHSQAIISGIENVIEIGA